MKKVKSLKEGQKYIALIIDGELTIVDLSGNRLHTDATNKPFWNGKELATVEALTNLEGVEDVEYDEGTAELTFTFHDGRTPLDVRLPHLDLIDDIEYDSDTEEIVLVKKDGTKDIRVPVGHLIDIYTGSEGAQIEIEVVGNNIIKATLIEGTITEAHLVQELQDKIAAIANKMDKVSDATEGNIAIFNDEGDVEDSGENLDDFVRKVEQNAEGLQNHTHDGENSPKVNYNNLLEKPVKRYEETGVAGDYSVDVETDLFNVEYVISKGALRQSGTLKVRGDDITELDTFGDDDEIDVSFSINGTVLTFNNDGGGSMDVQLLVFFLT